MVSPAMSVHNWLVPLGQTKYGPLFNATFGTVENLAIAASEHGALPLLDACGVQTESDREVLRQGLHTLLLLNDGRSAPEAAPKYKARHFQQRNKRRGWDASFPSPAPGLKGMRPASWDPAPRAVAVQGGRAAWAEPVFMPVHRQAPTPPPADDDDTLFRRFIGIEDDKDETPRAEVPSQAFAPAPSSSAPPPSSSAPPPPS